MIQSLRGFRDFYPEEQYKINFLRTKIAEVSRLFGYEEFEAPVLEPFELYAAKSSDEIVSEQAFTFEDRGGEKIALRPELTPSLARMVANRQHQLAFPLRWWSFGRFWRYERPQKGRAREFYQWNCDLLGSDLLLGDGEILEIVIHFLESLGLTAEDCVLEISNRAFINRLLTEKGLDGSKSKVVFRFLDKASKLTPQEQMSFAGELGLLDDEREMLLTLSDDANDLWQRDETLTQLIAWLESKGLDKWVSPNLSLVRGFNYYTGLVFEVSDRNKQYRAILGGGRYENLVSDVGGQPVSGIGFAMGDIVILSYLEEKGLLPQYDTSLEICIINLDSETNNYSQAITDDLRRAGMGVIMFGQTDNFGKGLKFASSKHIEYAILVGPNEMNDQTITFKNLTTGKQETLPRESILEVLARQEETEL